MMSTHVCSLPPQLTLHPCAHTCPPLPNVPGHPHPAEHAVKACGRNCTPTPRCAALCLAVPSRLPSPSRRQHGQRRRGHGRPRPCTLGILPPHLPLGGHPPRPLAVHALHGRGGGGRGRGHPRISPPPPLCIGIAAPLGRRAHGLCHTHRLHFFQVSGKGAQRQQDMCWR